MASSFRPLVVALLSAASLLPAAPLSAQTPTAIPASAASGLELRAIGPALMGGRIADIAVHPGDPRTWYIGVGSGGVWKTTNAGVTFTPVFDEQPSYSIGVVTIDPTRPNVVWVGTGENVSGRHVGWGDGVYRSTDAGKSWQRAGLRTSQHIGKIVVDPRDGDVVLVAAEGPLWSGGGERGVYRTTDGGATWAPVLQIDANTGVTDLEFDPSNPDVVYAAAYQRRRHVWGFLAGGEGSGIYKSTDNGATWREVTAGLPSSDMGKIGLAVSPANANIVYATIEATDENEQGFYRSVDKGESWERRNGYVSGGTGPHYYQEIEASPVDADVVYQMDVFLQVTRDGGRTFQIAESGHDKHSDNHALYIDPADPRHLLIGSDAGLYESFDEGVRWRHFPNMPISQFYKVALNDRAPFYDVLAGAQDLGTLHGPSRTMNMDGIRNQDWYVPLGADGYGVAFEPGDPEMMYMMTQEGNLVRKDRRNEEAVRIQPRAAPGDVPERWNWDSPLLVSPHEASRIYFGSQRLWRSEDRGNSWTAISPDLTLGQERYERPYYGRVWSVDALHDNGAMSKYATTTAISESPLASGTTAVGTDDGLVQVTTNGGETWTRAAALPELPPLSFVNDVELSQHDARTLYVAADAHKDGVFTPFLYASTDLGRSWRSIAGDLPAGTIVWAIQQDHVRPELLFAGTEFGVFWTPNGGANWHRLGGRSMPTTPVRDVKLHRRDGDLVAATFGRGIYVLDDYTPLRAIASGTQAAEGTVLPVRDAWWYVPHAVAQAPGRPTLGSDDFTAENPEFGALITVYVREVPMTARERRQAEEKALRARNADVPFPGYGRLREEALATDPGVRVVITDAEGRRVRTLSAPTRAGLHRIAWDLRGPSPEPVNLDPPGFRPPWAGESVGPLVAPGRYTALLELVSPGGMRQLGESQSFTVKPVPNLGEVDVIAVAAFQARAAELARLSAAISSEIGQLRDELRRVRATLTVTPRADAGLFARVDSVGAALAALQRRMSGDPARGRLDQSNELSIGSRVGSATSSFGTRQPATATQVRDAEIAAAELAAVARDLRNLVGGAMAELRKELEGAGAGWTPGRGMLRGQ